MTKKFLLRISDDLFEELRRWAAEDLRSVNAQMEFLLRQAVKRRKGEREDEEPLPDKRP